MRSGHLTKQVGLQRSNLQAKLNKCVLPTQLFDDADTVDDKKAKLLQHRLQLVNVQSGLVKSAGRFPPMLPAGLNRSAD